jgi:protein-L-isoaspartate(D-aspartate) O-methyltransferase
LERKGFDKLSPNGERLLAPHQLAGPLRRAAHFERHDEAGRRAGMKPMGEQHLALLRRHMVEIVDLHFDLASEEIGKDAVEANLRSALLRVPRHLFVPHQLAVAAYQDTPLPIGFDKTISQPFIGALMLDLLGLRVGQNVLEIGTGLGWQAAVMTALGARVRSVEIVEEFAEGARLRLASQGHDVDIRVGDGSRGWPEHSPFDRILVTAAAPAPPAALAAQLAPGGLMVIPLGGKEVQQLSVVTKGRGGTLETREVLPVRFTQLETAI